MPKDTTSREDFNDDDTIGHNLRDIAAQDGVAADEELDESYELTKETYNLSKDYATSEAEGDIPDELVKELAFEESAARKIYESADGSPEESHGDIAAQEGATANGASGHNLRNTADQWDVFADEAAGPDLRELPKEAVLDAVAANMPRKRSLGFKRKTKKVKST